MVLHFLEEGVDVVVYNRSSEKTDELKVEVAKSHFDPPVGGEKSSEASLSLRPAKGGTRSPDKLRDDRSIGKLTPCYNLNHLVNNLAPPRIIWLMVEHGKPVDEVIRELIKAGVTKGDIIIDGGNSFYKDSVKRHKFLKEKGINFLDMGTSGGLEGARNGACLMIGGEKNIYEKLVPLFQKLIGTKGG